LGARAGDKPFGFITSGNGKAAIILCGYAHQETGPDAWQASEYEVVECSQERVLFSFSAFEDCNVHKTSFNAMTLERLAYLPLGEGGISTYVPWQRITIMLDGSGARHTSKEYVLQAPRYSKAETEGILKSFHDKTKSRQPDENVDDLLVKLMLLSISGSVEGQSAFEEAKVGLRLGGADAEYYSILYEIYCDSFD
jgi:hypothetical protein